jgi:2-hydroxychromene-2-carboxylate isomerase
LVRRGQPFELRPVLFAGLLAHHGQLGPAEIPAKRAWLIRDTLRQAQRHDIPFGFPASHPFNPLTALRLSMAAVSGDDQTTVVKTLFELAWVHGGELSDDASIAAALNGADLDGEALVAATKRDGAKQALREATQRAIDAGVFGVPTMVADGELFWGADRIEDTFDHLSGALLIDEQAVRAAHDRLATAVRKR